MVDHKGQTVKNIIQIDMSWKTKQEEEKKKQYRVPQEWRPPQVWCTHLQSLSAAELGQGDRPCNQPGKFRNESLSLTKQ